MQKILLSTSQSMGSLILAISVPSSEALLHSVLMGFSFQSGEAQVSRLQHGRHLPALLHGFRWLKSPIWCDRSRMLRSAAASSSVSKVDPMTLWRR